MGPAYRWIADGSWKACFAEIPSGKRTTLASLNNQAVRVIRVVSFYQCKVSASVTLAPLELSSNSTAPQAQLLRSKVHSAVGTTSPTLKNPHWASECQVLRSSLFSRRRTNLSSLTSAASGAHALACLSKCSAADRSARHRYSDGSAWAAPVVTTSNNIAGSALLTLKPRSSLSRLAGNQ